VVTVNFQRLLFEEPHDTDDIFGKYLFDKTRKDVPSREKEPETSTEKQFRGAIDAYLESNFKKDLDMMIPAILIQTKPRNLYQHILEPGATTVYRALNVNQKAASRILSLDVDLLNSKGIGSVKNIVLKPSSGTKIQGWSPLESLIYKWLEFSEPVAVCAKTTTDKALFFGTPGELAKAAGAGEFIEEMETISHGPVPCDEIRFCTSGFYLRHPELRNEIRRYVSFVTDEIPI
jgi:hypothetical protein